MKKLVVFRIVAACILTLCILTFFQLTLDKNGSVKKFHFPADHRYSGDGGGNIYNVCSASPGYGVLDKGLSSLPRAFRVFSGPAGHTESCTSWSKLKFLQKSLLPVCRKLFTAQPLNRLQERWIADTNKQGAAKDSEDELVYKSMDCDWLRGELSSNFFVSAKERTFPIAYAINVDREPNQILQFLRVIYRPHNLHCLHYDSKSSSHTKQIMNNIAGCFGNVIIPRRIEAVYWGWHTIQDAFFNCFSDLVLARGKYPWRYVTTLCGMEVPLRTNAEIVDMLEPLNGTSSVQMVGASGQDDSKYKWKWTLNRVTGWVTRRDSPLPPIPYGLKVYKSWAYVALSHQFVQYLLCSPEATALRDYMKDVRIPEENTFAMLFMRPSTPGGYRPEHKDRIFPVVSLIWLDGDHRGLLKRLYLMLFPQTVCAGSKRHNICLVQARDLHRLSYRPGITALDEMDSYNLNPNVGRHYEGRDRGPLFHNKFSMAQDRVVMECMQQELARRNKMEYHSKCAPK